MFGDTQRSVFLLKKNQAFWPHSQTHTDLLSNPVSKSNLQFSAIRNVRFFSSKKVKAAGLIPKHIQSCLPILFRNLTLAQTTTQREKNTFVLLEIFGQTMEIRPFPGFFCSGLGPLVQYTAHHHHLLSSLTPFLGAP